MMGHTPGPWVRTYGNCIHAIGTSKEGHHVNRMHLTVHGGWTNGERTTEEEINATAQLIAAAPALADALEAVIRDVDGAVETTGIEVPSEMEWYQRALAALRAAGRLP